MKLVLKEYTNINYYKNNIGNGLVTQCWSSSNIRKLAKDHKGYGSAAKMPRYN